MMSFAQWGNALYSGDKSYAVVPTRVTLGAPSPRPVAATARDAKDSLGSLT